MSIYDSFKLLVRYSTFLILMIYGSRLESEESKCRAHHHLYHLTVHILLVAFMWIFPFFHQALEFLESFWNFLDYDLDFLSQITGVSSFQSLLLGSSHYRVCLENASHFIQSLNSLLNRVNLGMSPAEFFCLLQLATILFKNTIYDSYYSKDKEYNGLNTPGVFWTRYFTVSYVFVLIGSQVLSKSHSSYLLGLIPLGLFIWMFRWIPRRCYIPSTIDVTYILIQVVKMFFIMYFPLGCSHHHDHHHHHQASLLFLLMFKYEEAFELISEAFRLVWQKKPLELSFRFSITDLYNTFILLQAHVMEHILKWILFKDWAYVLKCVVDLGWLMTAENEISKRVHIHEH